jgi:predicted permease
MIGRHVLVIAQVALSMILLIAAGIVLAGVHQIVEMRPGFRTDHVLIMTIDTQLTNASAEESRTFYRNLEDEARRIPGVTSVGMTGAVPLDPSQEGENVVPEGHQLAPGQRSVAVPMATVNAAYFKTMEIPIVRGRAFVDSDRESTEPVLIVNEAFSHLYWPGQDPLGRRVRLASAESPWMTVVGMTKTGKYFFLGEVPQPFIYLPFAQHERSRMSLMIESASADPSTLAAPLRQVVRDLNPSQPVYNVRALATFYQQRALAIPRRVFQVVATMGVAGLVLALIGLYALVAYSVACRFHEIGVRMAIGARPANVLRMILRQGLTLSMAGVVIGAAASVAIVQLLIAGMSGLAAPSPSAYVVVPLLLIALTLMASYIPARRAAHIDPLQAVRHE